MRRSACSAERKTVCPLATRVWDEHTSGTVVLDASRAGSSSDVAPPHLESSVVTLDGDELHAWLVQHPPPRLAALFGSREEWDAEREPWFDQLMGERLPLYGDNEARTAAW
jgi:hypothetical protein